MFSRPLYDIYIGTRAVMVGQGDEPIISREATDLDSAVAELRSWLAANLQRTRLRIWLSGGLCRPFIMPAVAGVQGSVELQNVAASLAPRQTGLEGECIAWVDPRPATSESSAGRVAAAVQRQCLGALQDAVADQATRHRIVSIRPWWAELLRAALRREPQVAVVAVQDCDSLTVLAGQTGFSLANTVSPVVDRNAADAALARMLLSAADVAQGPQTQARLLPLRTPSLSETHSFAFAPYVDWTP